MNGPLLTDVRITGALLPEIVRQDWQPRSGRCSCGFPDGCHPMCVCCGVMIGPYHHERYHRLVAVPVFYDQFDETAGLWEVAKREEQRSVCRECAGQIDRHLLLIPSFRQHSRVRERLGAINRWRKAHNLPAATYTTPFTDAIRHGPFATI